MAGDWIKIEHWTPDKPEVFRIADILGIDPDAVTGKLIRIWIWADQQTIDGNAGNVTKTLLDRLCSVTGFADALIQAGWVVQEDEKLRFVNFDRHNGETAKLRALNAKRQAKYKASKGNRKVGNAKGDAVVTQESRSGNDAGVISALPKEEKRREEIGIASAIPIGGAEGETSEKPARKRKAFETPTVEQVAAYIAEIGGQVDPGDFVDYYTARGWMMTNGRQMRDWQATVRTWERKRRDGIGTHQVAVYAAASNAGRGIVSREQQREAANKAAFAGFLQSEGLFPSDLGFDGDEAHRRLHGGAAKGLVLRSEAIPGPDDQSVGRGTCNVGDAIPGACRPIPAVPAEDATGVLPFGGE